MNQIGKTHRGNLKLFKSKQDAAIFIPLDGVLDLLNRMAATSSEYVNRK